MKMLQGQLIEVRYAWPQSDEISSNTSEDGFDCEKLQEIGRKTLDMNGVCYINDTLGLHRVENPNPTEPAVSLHLYCPPFEECSVFNEFTGQRTRSQVTFYSMNGQTLK